MVRALLIRGMFVGFIAGLLAFGFAKVFGEPHIERAIAIETSGEAHNAAHSHDRGVVVLPAPHEPPRLSAESGLVSRDIQAGIGLFTGIVVYATAMGGLFSLVFAFANGRAARVSPRAMSALLSGAGFVAITLVPTLKYPASPPGVGGPESIGYRSALFFAMLAISIIAMGGAAVLRQTLAKHQDGWSAALNAAGAYLVIIIAANLLLPDVDVVPDNFPAVLLWQFRLAALGMQLILWATMGLLFGVLTERAAIQAANPYRESSR